LISVKESLKREDFLRLNNAVRLDIPRTCPNVRK